MVVINTNIFMLNSKQISYLLPLEQQTGGNQRIFNGDNQFCLFGRKPCSCAPNGTFNTTFGGNNVYCFQYILLPEPKAWKQNVRQKSQIQGINLTFNLLLYVGDQLVLHKWIFMTDEWATLPPAVYVPSPILCGKANFTSNSRHFIQMWYYSLSFQLSLTTFSI